MAKKLVVIGAGPGGYAAAFYAADRGMDVTLVEANKNLGGTCLNVGCIPSKALLHIAKLLDEAKHAKEIGIDFGEPKIDLDKIRSFKDGVIKKLAAGVKGLSSQRKVKVIHGFASFTSPKQLSVKTEAGQQTVDFDHAIIATGSEPIIPGPLRINSPRVMDSTGALELKDVPERFLIVGGGVIGLELGCVYAALGSKITVIEALPQILTGVDRDLVKPLQDKITKDYEAILVDTMVTSLKEQGDKIVVGYKNAKGEHSDTFDRVLLCIGRRPNTQGLNADKAGVKVDERGFVQVTRNVMTTAPHIFAIGDVVGNPMLAHKASREARVAVEKILGENSEFDNKGIPSVVYTDPEIAWVGLTEIDAKKQGIRYKIGKFPWMASGRALAVGRTEGLTKILFDENEHVIGVGIVGVNAGELIAEGGLALEMGAALEDLTLTIHAHPTLAETVLESAETVHNLSTHIYLKK